MKLWDKGYTVDQEIEAFTVGKDPSLDREILTFDIEASKAHTAVLEAVGVLTNQEKERLIACLNEIDELHRIGEFVIKQSDEDGHTAIENFLTAKLGDLGKKIHTARSRNDQVLVALRLYQKKQLDELIELLNGLNKQIEMLQADNKAVPMPGFTHTRKAMPHSVADWLGAFKESLTDDRALMMLVKQLIDKNPLGTGAGFGVPLDIDTKISTDILGFAAHVDYPLYTQNSRGKLDAHILYSCVSALSTLNKLSSDLILFTMPEFNYFTLPDDLTTGSSIMPHKKNPDVLELIRAQIHQVLAQTQQVMNTNVNIISGYNRDVQLTKEPLIEGIHATKRCLKMMSLVLSGLKINKEILEESMSDELFSVKKAYELVKRGVPFREAYRIVSEDEFGHI